MTAPLALLAVLAAQPLSVPTPEPVAPPVAATAVPASGLPSASPNAVTIENSGSTNFLGYAIVVEPSGKVRYRIGDRSADAQVPKADADRLFADLRTAGSLARLPVQSCMKSASFGSTTTMLWKGNRSPDLSCGGNASAEALKMDVDAVVADLHLQTPLNRHPSNASPGA